MNKINTVPYMNEIDIKKDGGGVYEYMSALCTNITQIMFLCPLVIRKRPFDIFNVGKGVDDFTPPPPPKKNPTDSDFLRKNCIEHRKYKSSSQTYSMVARWIRLNICLSICRYYYAQYATCTMSVLRSIMLALFSPNASDAMDTESGKTNVREWCHKTLCNIRLLETFVDIVTFIVTFMGFGAG